MKNDERKSFIFRLKRLIKAKVESYNNSLQFILKKIWSFFVLGLGHLILRMPHKSAQERDLDYLVLRKKYYSPNSKMVSTEKMHLDDTLAAANINSFKVITYEADLKSIFLADYLFLKICLKFNPKTIIFSSWNEKGLLDPDLKIIKLIKKKLNPSMVTICWDTCSKGIGQSLTEKVDDFDLFLIMDNPKLEFISNEVKAKSLALWSPQVETFFPQVETRDISVSFLGQVGDYRNNRRIYLDYIRNFFDINCHTNDRAFQVSHEEYANQLSRSKMSINFAFSVDCSQLKGRVFDSMLAGAMLLESENEQISKLFTPGIDYVPFSSKEDLKDKIEYYMNHPDELNTIAINGKNKVLNFYGHKNFWQKVEERLNEITKCK